MSFARRVTRRLYSRVFTTTLRARNPGLAVLDPKKLRLQMGGADTLHIAAPGPSVMGERALGADDDVLGVNYFVLCREAPLWSRARLFMIEPHPTYRLYEQALAAAAEAKGDCRAIVKGTASPSKFGASARLVLALAGIEGAKVILAQDMYISDLHEKSFAQAVSRFPDDTFCGSKSLLWAISYGSAAGYREIVLHGFDFSQEYAYSTSEDGDGAPKANSWVTDRETEAFVLGEVARLKATLSERGVRLSQCACDGPLTQLLPTYRAK